MRTIPAELAALAREQHGAISRAQCLATGLPAGTPARMVKLTRWQRPYPGVYVTHTGAISDLTRVWAAILAVGPDAVACGETGLWLAIDRGRLTRPIHLAVPTARALRQRVPGIVVHRMDTTAAVRLPPRMPIEHCLLEVVSRTADARAVIGLVCEVMGAKRTTTAWVTAAMTGRKRLRWRSMLTAMLAEVAEGAETPLEIADLRNDRRHGLPGANRQVTRRVAGQTQRVDVRIQPPGVAEPVVKELDGLLGHEGTGKFRDMIRDNVTILRGGLPLRFGWVDMVVEGCRAAAWQALLYRRLGWTGSPKPCRPGCAIFEEIEALDLEHPWEVVATS